MTKEHIKLIDLDSQLSPIRHDIDEAIRKVLDHGQYIMGPEVRQLEQQLCDYTGAQHCITVANGSDALQIALMALDVKPGDFVFVPSFTFTATAECILVLGATPVFVDVDENSFNLCPADLERKILALSKEQEAERLKAIIAVDLFGLPADYTSLQTIADQYSLRLIADAAQSFGGASGNGQKVGTLADITTTSFFPAKPLGCFGDGGAILTDCPLLNETIRSIRVHGKGQNKYDNVRVGLNSRLDTIQAAILLEKLKLLDQEIQRRNRIASRYSRELGSGFKAQANALSALNAFAQYTLVCENREETIRNLEKQNIPYAIYYPKPMHLQPAYGQYGHGAGSLPVSEELSRKVISIPVHAYLSDSEQTAILEALSSSR
ncbi:DegT/DnrJ/EryC1/StrS family aminotransferase [Kiloniella sp. b19]|uniref:DegT/DnrJ/EryC1/StrS family aminotransferase n=1 Tax=Kiloniella sp. GXU_MW_B19 TaxID=3141326 RepID=UPI0031DD7310